MIYFIWKLFYESMYPSVSNSFPLSICNIFLRTGYFCSFLSTHFIASQFPCLFFVKNLFIFFQCLWGLCWEPYGILCVRQRHIYSGINKNKETLSINQRQTGYLEAIDLLTCRQLKDEPDLIVITQNVQIFFLSFNFLVITNNILFLPHSLFFICLPIEIFLSGVIHWQRKIV